MSGIPTLHFTPLSDRDTYTAHTINWDWYALLEVTSTPYMWEKKKFFWYQRAPPTEDWGYDKITWAHYDAFFITVL